MLSGDEDEEQRTSNQADEAGWNARFRFRHAVFFSYTAGLQSHELSMANSTLWISRNRMITSVDKNRPFKGVLSTRPLKGRSLLSVAG